MLWGGVVETGDYVCTLISLQIYTYFKSRASDAEECDMNTVH